MLMVSKEIEQVIINDYVDNYLSIKELSKKYKINKTKITKILGDKIRSFSDAGKIAHKKHPESFKHSEETKKKISQKRLQFMKEHPEKTAWRQSTPSYPEQQFEKFLLTTDTIKNIK